MLKNALLNGRFLYVGQRVKVSSPEEETLLAGGFIAVPGPELAKALDKDAKISARTKRKR